MEYKDGMYCTLQLTHHIVEFATIRQVDGKVVYDLFKPSEIDALLKEQNVGADAMEEGQ